MGLYARRTLPGLLVTLLQFSNAWAQVDHPLSLPKPDVTVTYRFDKMSYGGPEKLRIMCGRTLRCKGKIGEASRCVQSCVRPVSAVLMTAALDEGKRGAEPTLR
jgi:hypothetical protein